MGMLSFPLESDISKELYSIYTMDKMIKISPSILSANFSKLGDEIIITRKSGS